VWSEDEDYGKISKGEDEDYVKLTEGLKERREGQA
jgi:hypothetical protein